MAIRPDIDIGVGAGYLEGQDEYARAAAEEMVRRRREDQAGASAASSRLVQPGESRRFSSTSESRSAAAGGGTSLRSSDRTRPAGLGMLSRATPLRDPIEQMQRAIAILDMQAENPGVFRYDPAEGRVTIDKKQASLRNAAKSERIRLQRELEDAQARLGLSGKQASLEQIEATTESLRLEMEANREQLRLARAKGDFDVANLAEDRDRQYKAKMAQLAIDWKTAGAKARTAGAAETRAETGKDKHASDVLNQQEKNRIAWGKLEISQRMAMIRGALADSSIKHEEMLARKYMTDMAGDRDKIILDGLSAHERAILDQFELLPFDQKESAGKDLADQLDAIQRQRAQIIDPKLRAIKELQKEQPGAALAPERESLRDMAGVRIHDQAPENMAIPQAPPQPVDRPPSPAAIANARTYPTPEAFAAAVVPMGKTPEWARRVWVMAQGQ